MLSWRGRSGFQPSSYSKSDVQDPATGIDLALVMTVFQVVTLELPTSILRMYSLENDIKCFARLI